MAIKNESVSQIDLSNLTRTQSVELLELLNAYDERLRYNKLEYYYPDKGPYARSFYQKHVEFFKAGREYKERIIFGANRSGKSIANTYECALHLTGLYPDWWEGIRFYTPTTCLMASDTFDRSRDILQRYLLGPLSDLGSGTIPKNCFQGCQRSPIDLREGLFTKPNVPQGISVAYIKHYTMGVFDGYSRLEFGAFQQGREGFQGTQYHYIGLDEEYPLEVYSEAVTRTTATGDFPGGRLVTTFTPMDGLSPTVLSFLGENGTFPKDHIVPGYPHRWITLIDWDDIPHIPEDEKRDKLASYPEHEKEARSKGIPAVGRGRIFTVPEFNFTVDPFTIPPHWKQCYGLDIPIYTGYAACVWMAYDEDNDIIYITDVYNVKEKDIPFHAEAIRRKGKWIPGVMDPSSVRKNSNGIRYIDEYRQFDLDLELADNDVDLGNLKIRNRLNSGTFKVFRHLDAWFGEYRIFRLDKNGKVAKNQKDDIMDATRYGIMSGIDRAKSFLEHDEESNPGYHDQKYDNRDSVTGY